MQRLSKKHWTSWLVQSRLLMLCWGLFMLCGCSARAPHATHPEHAAHVGSLTQSTRILGFSVRGRPIVVISIGHGPREIVLVGLIHGNEPEGFEEFEDLMAAVRGMMATGDRRQRYTLHAIPTVNPDGYEARTRGNANGVDLNRNWPTHHFAPSTRHGPAPLSEPETVVLHEFLEHNRPEVLIVLHSVGDGPFVDADGPGDRFASGFVEAAARVDPRWMVRSDYTNPPGSLGTWAGLEQGIATLTVEFKRGQDPTLARLSTEAGLRAILESMDREQPRLTQGAPDAGRSGRLGEFVANHDTR